MYQILIRFEYNIIVLVVKANLSHFNTIDTQFGENGSLHTLQKQLKGKIKMLKIHEGYIYVQCGKRVNLPTDYHISMGKYYVPSSATKFTGQSGKSILRNENIMTRSLLYLLKYFGFKDRTGQRLFHRLSS